MGAALNGIALHRGFIPFGGTFLIFSDYMRPSIRLAALTHLKPIYVFHTTRSAWAKMGRRISPSSSCHAARDPNMTVIRPSDATGGGRSVARGNHTPQRTGGAGPHSAKGRGGGSHEIRAGPRGCIGAVISSPTPQILTSSSWPRVPKWNSSSGHTRS